jgi:hypothetical protein
MSPAGRRFLEHVTGSCGFGAVDCLGSYSDGLGGGAGQALREENNANRRSGTPERSSKATKPGVPPKYAKGLETGGKAIGRVSTGASAVIGVAEGEGLGRVGVKTALSGTLAAAGAEAGLACAGFGAVVCSPALAVGGSIAGNVAGDVVSDVADPLTEKLGDAIGGDVGDKIGGLFSD